MERNLKLNVIGLNNKGEVEEGVSGGKSQSD